MSKVGSAAQRAFRGWADGFRMLDRGARLRLGLMLLILAVGTFLRARGYLWGVIGFDVDEAGWTRMLVSRPLTDAHLATRPILFMQLTKLLVQVFGAWEAVLRFLPWSLGLVALFSSPFLAARLFQSFAARVFFVAVIALHPAAIDLAKEFKPYSVSLALHCLLIWFALRYAATRRTGSLMLALGTAPIGILLAQDVAFLYPGLFLALLLDAWRASLRHALFVCAGALLTLGTVALLYVLIWSQIELGPSGGETVFWAKKYGTFYTPGDPEGPSLLGWLVARLFDTAAFPGFRNEIWESGLLSARSLGWLTIADRWLWVALVLLGVVAIAARRKLRLVLLLLLPLATLCLLNLRGFWPFGVFRTNLFLLVYTAALAAWGVGEIARRLPRWADPLPTLFFVVLPLLAFESTWHGNKRIFSESSAFPGALRGILRLQGPSYAGPAETVLLDNRTCSAWKFYTRLHPGVVASLPGDFERRLSPECVRTLNQSALRAQVRREQRRVWLISNRWSSLRSFREGPPQGLVFRERIEVKLGGDLTELVLAAEPL